MVAWVAISMLLLDPEVQPNVAKGLTAEGSGTILHGASQTAAGDGPPGCDEGSLDAVHLSDRHPCMSNTAAVCCCNTVGGQQSAVGAELSFLV